MNFTDACKYAKENELNISRQGLYSSALVYGFAEQKKGRILCNKEGLDEFIQFKTDRHPEYIRLYFTEYDTTSVTVLATLLKNNIEYKRYGVNFIIKRRDIENVKKVLRKYRRND